MSIWLRLRPLLQAIAVVLSSWWKPTQAPTVHVHVGLPVTERQAQAGPGGPYGPPAFQSLDYVHDMVRAQLEAQAVQWEELDGRLRLILGVITIVFAALGAVLQRTSWTVEGKGAFPFTVGAAVVVAAVLFLIAAAIVAKDFWRTRFDRPPAPESLVEGYLHANPTVTKEEVLYATVVAYNRNVNVMERKYAAFRQAFMLTAVATGLLGLALMLQVTCESMAPSWWPLGDLGC